MRELKRIVEAIGNSGAAYALGVDRSLVSRWLSQTERISPAKQRAVSEVDFVLRRGLQAFTPAQLTSWLGGSEPHLAGARPIDVLRLEGASRILRAIEAIEQGAFA